MPFGVVGAEAASSRQSAVHEGLKDVIDRSRGADDDVDSQTCKKLLGLGSDASGDDELNVLILHPLGEEARRVAGIGYFLPVGDGAAIDDGHGKGRRVAEVGANLSCFRGDGDLHQ